MLHSVGPVPMVPEVCLKIPEFKLGIRTLSFFFKLIPLPPWPPLPLFSSKLKNIHAAFLQVFIYPMLLWGLFFLEISNVHPNVWTINILIYCADVCVCVSVNGKFPHDRLHSHLKAVFLFSIPLCHPPVHLCSCLTSVFVSSRERIKNTTCHKLFGEFSLFLLGGVFIIPWL